MLQKLSEADKLYSSSAAAYMSDPRLCHTTALRLGTATPTGGGDSKHGKQEAADLKLAAVKEEETGVESGPGAVAGAGDTDYLGGRVTAVTWCDNIIQTELGVGVAADPALAPPTIYMCPAPEQPKEGGGGVGGAAAGSEGGGVASTCCSVFSLSECCVVAGVGAAPGPAPAHWQPWSAAGASIGGTVCTATCPGHVTRVRTTSPLHSFLSTRDAILAVARSP